MLEFTARITFGMNITDFFELEGTLQCDRIESVTSGVDGVLIIMIFFVVKFNDKFVYFISKTLGKVSQKLSDRIAEIFKTLSDGFSALKGTSNIVLTLFYTCLIMFAYGLNAYIGFYVIHMNEIKEVTLGMGWIVMTISAFGIVLPAPGGTGTYHFIVISVLTGLFGFSQEISGAYAFITHIISYVIFVTLTFLILLYINYKRKRDGFNKETFVSVFKIKPEEK